MSRGKPAGCVGDEQCCRPRDRKRRHKRKERKTAPGAQQTKPFQDRTERSKSCSGPSAPTGLSSRPWYIQLYFRMAETRDHNWLNHVRSLATVSATRCKGGCEKTLAGRPGDMEKTTTMRMEGAWRAAPFELRINQCWRLQELKQESTPYVALCVPTAIQSLLPTILLSRHPQTSSALEPHTTQ